MRLLDSDVVDMKYSTIGPVTTKNDNLADIAEVIRRLCLTDDLCNGYPILGWHLTDDNGTGFTVAEPTHVPPVIDMRTQGGGCFD